jgi:hypothetical protein
VRFCSDWHRLFLRHVAGGADPDDFWLFMALSARSGSVVTPPRGCADAIRLARSPPGFLVPLLD